MKQAIVMASKWFLKADRCKHGGDYRTKKKQERLCTITYSLLLFELLNNWTCCYLMSWLSTCMTDYLTCGTFVFIQRQIKSWARRALKIIANIAGQTQITKSSTGDDEDHHQTTHAKIAILESALRVLLININGYCNIWQGWILKTHAATLLYSIKMILLST